MPKIKAPAVSQIIIKRAHKALGKKDSRLLLIHVEHLCD
jgi:hypothetical protein